jgi:catalase
LFDGLVLPDGASGVKLLGTRVEVMDFISNQVRHGKTVLALGTSKGLIRQAGMASTLANGKSDPGILLEDAANAEQAATAFIGALGKHRHPERETGALMP